MVQFWQKCIQTAIQKLWKRRTKIKFYLFVCGEGDTKLHCLWIPRLYLVSQGQAHEGPLPIPSDFLTKFTLRNDGFWGIPSPAHALWRLMTLCHSLWQNGMVANARGYHVRSGRMAHQIAMYYYNLLFINKEFPWTFSAANVFTLKGDGYRHLCSLFVRAQVFTDLIRISKFRKCLGRESIPGPLDNNHSL